MSFHLRWEFWLYLAAWLPYMAFVVLYAARSPWHVTSIGRSLLLSKTVIAALLAHILALYIWPAYPGHNGVRVVIVGTIIVAGWWVLATLLRVQAKDRARGERRSGRDRRSGRERRSSPPPARGDQYDQADADA